MSSSFSENPNSFLPETFIIPEEPEELNIKLYQYLNDIASSVNSKTSGLYYSEEVETGQEFIPTFNTAGNANTTPRSIYRVVVDTGAIPNAAAKTVAHGITTTQDFSVIKLYGAATWPGATTITAALTLPTINLAVPVNSIQLNMDATNITITTTTASFVNFTRSYVIVEYIKLV